jgi:uncharacterized protein (TIGR02301 family)
MKKAAPRPFALGFGLCLLALGVLAWAPVAEAQFFWSPFFQQEQPHRPKPRPKAATPSADDLPPIVPKESAVPPPPDDRPYDAKLLRLAQILGAVHYLRELCGAQEGQLWRNEMQEILKNEGSTAVRRAKLVNSFNDGYRGYRRTYRSCTSSATLAVTRFSTEGAQIAAALAKPSQYAARTTPAANTATPASDATAPDAKKDETKKDAPNKTEASTGAVNQPAAGAGETSTGEANKAEGATPPVEPDGTARHEKHKQKKADHTGPAAANQTAPADQFPGINR